MTMYCEMGLEQSVVCRLEPDVFSIYKLKDIAALKKDKKVHTIKFSFNIELRDLSFNICWIRESLFDCLKSNQQIRPPYK